MTNKQEDNITMVSTVEDFEKDHGTISSTLPNYPVYFTGVKGLMAEIRKAAEEQVENSTGVAATKTALKNNLARLAASTASKTAAYAAKTENSVLAKAVEISESKMQRSPDTAILNYAQLIYDKAEENKAELAPYRITDDTQAELLKAKEDYAGWIAKPRTKQNKQSEATKQIAKLLVQVNALLKKMDKEVEILRYDEPEYYASYQKARKIIDTGGRGGKGTDGTGPAE